MLAQLYLESHRIDNLYDLPNADYRMIVPSLLVHTRRRRDRGSASGADEQH